MASCLVTIASWSGETYSFLVEDGIVRVKSDVDGRDEYAWAFTLPETAKRSIAAVEHPSGMIEVQYWTREEKLYSMYSFDGCQTFEGPVTQYG